MAIQKRVYRNLLAEIGIPQKEIDERIDSTWRSIFDPSSPDRFYFESDDETGYMMDTGNYDARTEGMSYGMMMAVQMDRKDVFDRLWKWSVKHMFMTEGKHAGYFAWSCKTDGTKNAHGPAPDGEEYYALALFFASERWGDSAVPFDYSEQARSLLRTCVHQGEKPGGLPMWNPDNYQIKFIPEFEFTDPSYHLPHFYDIFAERAYPEDREFWKKAAKASRDFLPTSCHPVTGLAPEYANYDGTPNHFNDHGDFFSDSYRVAANVGLEASWCGNRSGLTGIADRIQAFFDGKDPASYKSYKIDGTPMELACLHPVGLIATNAAASLAASEGPVRDRALSLFWNTPPRTGERRYYDNCLYFFSLLALAGRYVIY